MDKSPEFLMGKLPSGSKGTYRLPVRVEEKVDLASAAYLASTDVVCQDNIQDEIEKRFQGQTLFLPILAARGTQEGKTLVVTAGVHGDEYEGMEAIYRIFESLDPRVMKGSFVAVPVVTLPAFWLGSRVNPLDQKNMARVFPGSPEGTCSQRVAHMLLHRVLREGDLYIDCHSSGRNYQMMTLVGYSSMGKQAKVAKQAAEVFGAPFIWEHVSVSPGRTLSSTLALGIPSLYTEAQGGGQARREDVECYTRGVANILKLLEIAELPQASAPEFPSRCLYGSGDLDLAHRCTKGGLFYGSVPVGTKVAAGDRIGIIRDLEGRVAEKIVSPEGGVVMLIRSTPRIFPGETVMALTDTR